jgi:hypothetical protein
MNLESTSLYPVSPNNVPKDLTKASVSYKRHAWFALLGLLCFISFYIALMICFGVITFNGFTVISTGKPDLVQYLITGSALLFVNQRAKLTRVLGKTALKSFHPRLFKIRYFVGASWSVRNGYYCGSQKATPCQWGVD